MIWNRGTQYIVPMQSIAALDSLTVLFAAIVVVCNIATLYFPLDKVLHLNDTNFGTDGS